MSGARGIVLDMEGVLHVDWQPIPGSAEAVAELRRRGLELCILTNTTGRSREQIARQLAEMGFEFGPARIVTAAWAAAGHVRSAHPGARVFAMVEPGGMDELAGLDLVDDPERADVLLLGGPDDRWTYGLLNRVFRALMRGVPMVAMQRNRWWPTRSGPFLDAGMFVTGLEYSAGCRATVIGKPSPEIYRMACRLLDVPEHEAMMVGDDLEFDLPPARDIGMRTCLVRTGKGSGFPGEAGVDLDVPDLAALPQALDDA